MPLPFATVFVGVIPWIFAALAGLSRFIPWFTRIGLTSLGVGVATYTGMDALFNLVIDRVNSQIGGLPADLAALIDYMGVVTAVQIITSAVSVRLASSLINGALTRWRARPFVLRA